ncbi:hypothetical protein RFI_33435, partial [Reticulomyxa filosa]
IKKTWPWKQLPTEDNIPFKILLGNESLYLLYRYVQKLYAKLEHGRYCCTLDYTLRRVQTQEDKAHKYQELTKILIKQFSQGKREDRFEDSIRQLLGLQGYHLFNVPKIVDLLVGNVSSQLIFLCYKLYTYSQNSSLCFCVCVYM